MIAEEMAELLRREFWCFDTYTEISKEFADEMAIKNALRHCYILINTDPAREHMEHIFYQHKLGVDDDFYGDVIARLEKQLDEFYKKDNNARRHNKAIAK